VVVPWCLDESKSESILGSAALATRLLWGPAVPSGTPLLLWWCVVEEVEVVEWSLLRWRAFLTLSMVDMLSDFVWMNLFWFGECDWLSQMLIRVCVERRLRSEAVGRFLYRKSEAIEFSSNDLETCFLTARNCFNSYSVTRNAISHHISLSNPIKDTRTLFVMSPRRTPVFFFFSCTTRRSRSSSRFCVAAKLSQYISNLSTESRNTTRH